MSRGISVLRLGIAKKGQPYADRMRCVPRDMSALSLAYHLVVRFRRAPKGMSVVRFSLAKAGHPLVDSVRRVPMDVRCALLPCQGRPAVG